MNPLKCIICGPTAADTLPRQGFTAAAGIFRKQRDLPTFGILRVVCMAIASLTFVFPVVYIDEVFEWLRGNRDDSRTTSAVGIPREVYVVGRLLFFVLMIFTPWNRCNWAVGVTVYLICDMMHNLLGGVFVWGKLSILPKRSLLLSVVNFGELILAFTVMYIHFDALSVVNAKETFIPMTYSHHALEIVSTTETIRPVDALYFSMVTGMTVGYGDIIPKFAWHWLVMLQIACSVLFIFLVFTTFASRIQSEVRALSSATNAEADAPNKTPPGQ